MEFLLNREICKEFLDKYNKNIYPELLSRIIEIGILTLKLSFRKLTFTPNELDDIIKSLNEQSKQELKSIKCKKLKKLTNKYFNQERNEKENNLKFNNTISSIDNIYDKIYINNTNFYDSNYIIPESRSFRNKQLYQKRLENPLFTTQNKNVYPFWWWNFPDSDDEDINFNISDYMTQSKARFSNNQNSEFDEAKIFPRSSYNKDINSNNNYYVNDGNNNKDYFNNSNQSNYKISYDRNLNVIGVEKTENKGKAFGKRK
jgi:hypothetical protein